MARWNASDAQIAADTVSDAGIYEKVDLRISKLMEKVFFDERTMVV